MPSLQSLPQELLEEILIYLIWMQPVSHSVHLRSVDKWFCNNYDRLLFKQKRLLEQQTTGYNVDYVSGEHGSDQYLYGLEGVIPVTLAVKLAKHEWHNEEFLPKGFRLLIQQIEKKVVGLCWPYTQKDARLVKKDVRRAIVQRMSFPTGIFRVGFSLVDYSASVLERHPELSDICEALINESPFSRLTLDQSRILDREATALTAAVSDPRYVKSVIKAHAEMESRLLYWSGDSESSQTHLIPLQIAAMCGHVENVRWLAEHAEKKGRNYSLCIHFRTALSLVALTNEAKAAEIIRDAYCKLETILVDYMRGSGPPFQRACSINHLEVAKVLETLLPASEDGHKRDSQIRDAMHRSCKYGAKSSILKYLIELGALENRSQDKDNSYATWSPLSSAIHFGHKRVIKVLLESGASVHQIPNANSLYWPIRRGDLKLLRMLMDAGLDLFRDFPRERGGRLRDAVLPIACSVGQIEVVSLMLQTYPEIIKSEHGHLGVDIAMETGHRAILKLLVDKGAVSDRDAGAQALFSAVQSADVDAVKVLIKAGVDLNQPSKLYAEDKKPFPKYKRMTVLAVAKGHALVPGPRRTRFVKMYGILRRAGAVCRSSHWVPVPNYGEPSPDPEMMEQD